ncbi:hypothetical protein [Burkholderia ubonensis]|uniref:hypothetical protein n=1 Tax=Burkholderia ubonensis TaxID=101571 RepID=UPI000AA9FBE1
MSRSKLLVITVAVAGVIVAAVAIARSGADQASAPGAAGVAPASEAAGRYGGVALKNGKLSVEIVMTEKPGDARLVVYPFVDGRPARRSTCAASTPPWRRNASRAITNRSPRTPACRSGSTGTHGWTRT